MISRAKILVLAVLSAVATAAAQTPNVSSITDSSVRAMLSILSDDSMEGRMTASRGAARATNYIAAQMYAAHLVQLGDSGYFQRVPLLITSKGLTPFTSAAAVPGTRKVMDVNVIGMIRGSDPVLRNEYILVDAHFDHLGIGAPVNGDSIYNGADDDASGVVTVLSVTRVLAAGPAPKRSILFVTTTGEEEGLFGTRWLIDHFPVPLDSVKANLEIEMIGRPDTLIGVGHAWLTGWERTTMGPMFKAADLPIVADPHPTEQFFQRSDNIAFAHRGIPAQTLSSFGLHADYHEPSDDMSRVDIPHMTAVIRAAAQAVWMLANGPLPTWLAGGKP
jgi:Zn-dependent M28 family amino/carboxypeptidase